MSRHGAASNAIDETRNVGIRITRQTYTWENFNDKFEYNSEPNCSPIRETKRMVKKCCTPRCMKNAFFRFLPFISIMRHYNWKRDLIKDVIAGATVSAMHIPQGMAYGQLATLRPVHGLYVSFFPVLLYFFFGTSRHISIGSFAVISLMVAKVLDSQIAKGIGGSALNQTTTDSSIINNMTTNASIWNNSSAPNNTVFADEHELETRVDLAVSLNLITGLLQMLLGLLGFGFITAYLSDPFISGYTTGCACQVFTSQLKYVFGVRMVRHTGAFKIYQTWRDVMLNIANTNVVTLGVSTTAALFLIVCKFVVDPRIKNWSPMPIPAELILMIMADVVSYFTRLGPDHNVQVVGNIPNNFPVPHLPTYFMPQLIMDSIPVALVSFSLCISMGKLFAKQKKYKIYPNQEFLAVGLSNAVSSFFTCYPASASMSRSLVQANVGGQTQLAGVISCAIILSVILFLGTLLQPLPTCILAVVVMVNLRGMFTQAWDLKKYWRHCKTDAATWIVAFLATVIIDVDIGLYIGVSFVLMTVIFKAAKVHMAVMRQAGGTELFAQSKSYGNLSSTHPAVVIRWYSPIYFATVDQFLAVVANAANVTLDPPEASSSTPADAGPSSALSNRTGELEPVKAVVFGAEEEPIHESPRLKLERDDLAVDNGAPSNGLTSPVSRRHVSPPPLPPLDEFTAVSSSSCSVAKNVTAVILDLAGVTFVDTVGLDAIKLLAKDLNSNGVHLLLASCPDCVLEILATDSDLSDEFNRVNVFVAPVDALVALKRGDTFARFKAAKEESPEKPVVERLAPRRRNLYDSQTSLIAAQLDEEMDDEHSNGTR